MENTVVIGAQWGDEGKAKITDLLAEKADLIIRYQGGCNAGHTVVAGGKTYKFHMIPSGILYDKTICFIGAGTVIHPESFERELNELKAEGVDFKNLKISPLASITMPYHIEIDGYSEAHSGKGKIGTTKKGIGPTYTDKAARIGFKIQDLYSFEALNEKIDMILPIKNKMLKNVYGLEEYTRDCILSLCEKYAAEEERVQSWLDQPIGHLSRALLPGEKAEMALHGSPIADFLNRIQLHFSGAQLSAVGLANEIAGFRSEVSVRDIIATYPYPNTLIVCRISGKQLKQVMERSAEYFVVATDGTVQVAESFLVPKVEHYNYDYYMGAAYEIDPAAPVGNRIKNLTYQGKTVTETDSFTLCLNNYRYSGAGGYEVYTGCELVREINTEMVELILEYFKENPYVEV